jgi:hypothetical protein
MKIIKGSPPEGIGRTHAGIEDHELIEHLVAYGVPLRRYTEGLLYPWAEKWAAQLVIEWCTIDDPPNVVSEDVLKRVVSYVLRSGEADFAQAAVSVFRLTGDLEAVKRMLDERKDLVRR